MAMKKFKANIGYQNHIEELEIIKETDSFITYMYKGYRDEFERKEKKHTTSHEWFDTKEEAKQWLMDRIDFKIQSHQSDIGRLKSQKQKVNNL